jgi:hypothetical protein
MKRSQQNISPKKFKLQFFCSPNFSVGQKAGRNEDFGIFHG